MNMTFLQETHSTLVNEPDWKREWAEKQSLSHRSSNSGGVGVLFSKDFAPLFTSVEEPIKGQFLKINTEFENVMLVFVNVYAPTAELDRMIFLEELEKVVASCNSSCS